MAPRLAPWSFLGLGNVRTIERGDISSRHSSASDQQQAQRVLGFLDGYLAAYPSGLLLTLLDE